MVGILTGANNSVSLANAFLRMVTESLIDREGVLVFKRYIDDIICHFWGTLADLNAYIDIIIKRFLEFEMKLEFRFASWGSVELEVEFLDINHKFYEKDQYLTSNFIKATAVNRLFFRR